MPWFGSAGTRPSPWRGSGSGRSQERPLPMDGRASRPTANSIDGADGALIQGGIMRKPRKVRVQLAIAGLGSALGLGIDPHVAAANADAPRAQNAPLIYQKTR